MQEDWYEDDTEEDEDSEEIPEFFKVTDYLDLHGFFPEQVPEMIDEFIKNALDLNLKSLKVVHGKGKSKLKWIVRKILETNPHVESFHDAPRESGGWGATLITLKE